MEFRCVLRYGPSIWRICFQRCSGRDYRPSTPATQSTISTATQRAIHSIASIRSLPRGQRGDIAVRTPSSERLASSSKDAEEVDAEDLKAVKYGVNPAQSHGEQLPAAFFSATPQRRSGKMTLSSTRQEEISDSSMKDKVIIECDKAIVLSRGSSDPKSFIMARTCLERATKALWQLIDRGPTIVLDYEIYVLRSTFIHVMRIVGTLAGRQSALVCAAIMLNFLDLEDGLSKSGMSLPDGSSEWLRSRKSVLSSSMSIRQREEELQEIYLIAAGPFVHDVVPLLYDIFSDLTMRKTSPDARSATLRGFSTDVHYVAAHSIWTAVKSLAPTTWAKMTEIDERLFRHRLQSNMRLRTGLDVIDACTLMYVNACLQSDRTEQAVEVWRQEAISDTRQSSKSEKILEMIARRLRYDCRRLSPLKNADTDQKDCQTALLAYAKSLHAIVKVLADEESCTERRPLSTSQHFDILVRRMLKSAFLLDADLGQHSKDVSSTYESALSLWLTWIERHMNETFPALSGRSDRFIVSIATCNAMFSTLSRVGAGYGTTLIYLLRAMMSNDRFPTPDRATWTILLNNSARLPDLRMIPATLQAAYQLNLSSQDTTEEANSQKDSTEVAQQTSMTSIALFDEILKDAVANNDEHRVLALLNLARQSQSLNLAHSQSSDPSVSVPSIPADRLVFTLYPSLDLTRPSRSPAVTQHRWRYRRKMAAFDNGEPVKRATKDEIMKREEGVQFTFPVLSSVLRFLVSHRKTGLAERFWRFMWRVRNRKVARRRLNAWQSPDEMIPVSAFTHMFRLYAYEQRRAAKVIKLRALLPYQRNVLPARQRFLLSKSLVRGWGRYGPVSGRQYEIKNRSKTAREGAMHCYAQMRALWPDHNPALMDAADRPDLPLFHSLLSVFTTKSGDVRRASAKIDSRLSEHERAFLRTVKLDMHLLQVATPKSLDPL